MLSGCLFQFQQLLIVFRFLHLLPQFFVSVDIARSAVQIKFYEITA